MILETDHTEAVGRKTGNEGFESGDNVFESGRSTYRVGKNFVVGSVEEEQEIFCAYQVEEKPANASNHPPIPTLFQVHLLQHVIQV